MGRDLLPVQRCRRPQDTILSVGSVGASDMMRVPVNNDNGYGR